MWILPFQVGRVRNGYLGDNGLLAVPRFLRFLNKEEEYCPRKEGGSCLEV